MFTWIINFFKKLFGIKDDEDNNQSPAPIATIDTIGREPMKKAFLVGINEYMIPNANLRGCVNDTKNMYDILTNIYKFPADNIRVVNDLRATKQGIIDRLNWLVTDVKAGDELIFHYSGHGSQVRDRNGDELNDQLDEILCPTDLDWNDPLTDDYLAIVLKSLPVGVFFTMLCDSCHSGSMTRGFGNPHLKDDGKDIERFLAPPFDIASRAVSRKLKVSNMGKKQDEKGKAVPQNHVLISGCKDNQTSADAYINNTYQGAFSWALTSAIKSNPDTTVRQAHQQALASLKGRYTQIPQLSGDDSLLDRKIFGGK